jgi:phosphinothricin acetyltransferase
MHPPTVRDARPDDLPSITAIFNEVIATSTAVYYTQPTTQAERTEWYRGRVDRGYPVLVAEHGAEVVGFSSFAEFRGAWPGYRHSVEHSVHVRADRRGQGVGSALVAALFPRAGAMRKHVIIGGIDASNDASMRLHQRLGFEKVAHFREVGHKFGRWLDLVFMQRFIDAPGAPRSD